MQLLKQPLNKKSQINSFVNRNSLPLEKVSITNKYFIAFHSPRVN